MSIELNNEQIYAIYDLENWWNKSDDQLFQISGAAGTGKCQPDDTIIPTPDGEKRLDELHVGDYVFNKYGEPVKILGIYTQGEKEAFKVTFEDGRSTICNDEHLWTYYVSSHGKLQKRTTELKEIINYGLLRGSSTTYSCAIPQSKAVVYREKEFDVDPYVIGAFLGNGCCTSKQLSFSSNDIDTVTEITKLLNAESYHKNPSNYTYTFKQKCTNGVSHYYQTKDVFKNVPELCGLSYTKRIPEKYMYGSISQRWDLIQGLFDTDGSIQKTDRGNITYTSVSFDLIMDIKKLLASLGCSSTYTVDSRSDKYTTGFCYTLFVRVDNYMKPNFFRLPRKKEIAMNISDKDKKRNYSLLKITKIKDLGYKTPMRCIYVDDPEHLYLTNDYIVTHNTTIIRYFIERLGLEDDEVLFVAYMGKAASQMARNGLPAKTIHSAIYEYTKIIARDDDGKMIFLDNGKPKMVSKFIKKDRIGKHIKLIVIDEGSMVEEKIAKDLLSYNIPVIVLGDLNQLPPVFGKSYFLTNPNIILKQIMRQEEGNPIVWLSQEILAGHALTPGVYGHSAVINKKDINEYHFRNADVVLTGTNRLRYNINTYYREELKQIKNLQYPHIGEKVICRKNNWNKSIDGDLYLTNGTAGFVEYIYRDSFNGKTMSMDFRPDFSTKSFKNVTFDYKHLYEQPGTNKDMANQDYTSIYNDRMEFAYAITTHSSQGSQYGNVLYLAEEFMHDKEDMKKLNYTAITRAMNQITIVL